MNKIGPDLHRWATDEMHYHPPGSVKPLTDSDYSSLCRGQTFNIWKFVIKHVYSAQTAKKVRGNRNVRKKSASKEGPDSDENVNKLNKTKQELKMLMTECNQIEKELARQQEEVSFTQSEVDKQSEYICDIKRKSHLLRIFSNKNKQASNQYSTYLDKLDDKLKYLLKSKTNLNMESDEYILTENQEAITNGSNVESKILDMRCAQGIKETCDSINDFLAKILSASVECGNIQDKSNEELEDRKSCLLTKVEDVMMNNQVDSFVKSLTIYVSNSGMELNRKALAVNVRKDAEQLRFKYEKAGALEDLSSEQSPIQAVHQLIEEGQNRHVQTFLKTQSLLNHACSTQQQLEVSKQSIAMLLEKMFSEKLGDVQLSLQLIDSKINLCADHVSLQCLKEEAEKLRQSIKRGREEEEVLLSRHNKIQDFQSLVSIKQNLIRNLAKQNLSSRSSLDSKQDEMSKYILSTINTHYPIIRSVVSELSGCVKSEADVFSQLCLPYLVFLSLDDHMKTASVDLSIHSDKIINSEISSHILDCRRLLAIPPWKASEIVLSQCMRLKDKCYKPLCVRIGVEDQLTVTQRIERLCEDVDKYQGHLLDDTLPHMENRQKRLDEIFGRMPKMNTALKNWWDIPGCFSVPWVKRDNLSAEQIYNMWHVLSVQIKQAQGRQ